MREGEKSPNGRKGWKVGKPFAVFPVYAAPSSPLPPLITAFFPKTKRNMDRRRELKRQQPQRESDSRIVRQHRRLNSFTSQWAFSVSVPPSVSLSLPLSQPSPPHSQLSIPTLDLFVMFSTSIFPLLFPLSRRASHSPSATARHGNSHVCGSPELHLLF